MKGRQTKLASAVAFALAGLTSAAHAQQAPQSQAQTPQAAPTQVAQAQTQVAQANTNPSGDANQQPQQVEKVEVRGIRGALEKSIDAKKNADNVTEVINAEDIGKLPDKNVADAIQRLPGVNTSSQAAGEGGFDENDRVSIRGTSPSLTQVLINNHFVSSGDWFILDQFQTVGRSVSFSLLPAEIVQQVTVNLTPTADQIEGGVAGLVNIETRKPLDFAKQFTAEGQIQGVYSDLPGKTDPQFNALFNWKNDANTFGVMVQAFSEERHLRRDGQEFLGYQQLGVNGAPAPKDPALTGVAIPTFIGSALFEQDRKRNGGDIDFELKPMNNWTINVDGFYSKLDATNYNRNFLAWPVKMAENQVPTSYTIQNNTLTSATFANNGNPAALEDDIYRPDESSQTQYLDLSTTYRLNDTWLLSAQGGHTQGRGETPSQPAYEGQVNGGLTYQMNGISSPASVSLPGANPASFAGVTTSWSWNEIVHELDHEDYVQADALHTLQWGPIESVKFGARYNDHVRETIFPVDGGCLSSCFNPATNVPVWGGADYPSDFGSGLDAGSGFLSNVWQLSPSAIQSYVAANVNSTPGIRDYWPGAFKVEEKDTAAYLMANLGGDRWGGNFGVRLVQTKEESTVNVSGGPDPVTISAFGPYTPTMVDHTYTDVLPSLNLFYDLTSDQKLRAAIGKTIARPDYSALGGAVSLNDQLLSGSGGNPNLKPIRSTNYDVEWEWYFAPKSLIQAGVFYYDFANYVGYQVNPATYFCVSCIDPKTGLQGVDATYQITSPDNVTGKDTGFSLGWQQPIWGGFGAQTNYTYATGSSSDGGPLVGSSKNTFNVIGYYEWDKFSARVAYTYRSHFLVGLDRSFAENEDSTDDVALSLNYAISKKISLNFDILNLNNPILKYYAENASQPRAFYNSGRQYYFGARFEM